MSPNKSIVFAHGIWADGSCFSKLIPTLWAEGYEVITTEHSLDGHHGDVDCVLRTIGRTSNPVVLVGHSYGGGVLRGSLQDTLSSRDRIEASTTASNPTAQAGRSGRRTAR